VGRAYITNGEKRNAYRILVGKPERKRPLGRPRRRWVDRREIGWGSCEHRNELSGSIKFWESLEQLHNWYLLKECSAP
jgi:hypothetical protein